MSEFEEFEIDGVVYEWDENNNPIKKKTPSILTDEEFDALEEEEEEREARETQLWKYDLTDEYDSGDTAILKEKDGKALIRFYDSDSPACESPATFQIREEGGNILWNSGITSTAEYAFEGVGTESVVKSDREYAEERFNELTQ